MRILIVEDEVRLAQTLADLLKREGYSSDLCHDGESGLDNALSGIYDAVILDLMLPKRNGFEVLRAMRQEKCFTPVLLLTARSELEDRVRGLDSGANYYLTKPFEPQELLACLRVLTRRKETAGEDGRALRTGDLVLDYASFSLRCGEKTLRLSRKEFDLLEYLMYNARQVVTKEQLLVKVWGYESEAEDNNVEAYVSFLRKKLAHLHSRMHIRTIRMVGYCLEEEA